MQYQSTLFGFDSWQIIDLPSVFNKILTGGMFPKWMAFTTCWKCAKLGSWVCAIISVGDLPVPHARLELNQLQNQPSSSRHPSKCGGTWSRAHYLGCDFYIHGLCRSVWAWRQLCCFAVAPDRPGSATGTSFVQLDPQGWPFLVVCSSGSDSYGLYSCNCCYCRCTIGCCPSCLWAMCFFPLQSASAVDSQMAVA